MTDEKINQILQKTLAPMIPDESLNQNLIRMMEEKRMKKKTFTMKKTVVLVAVFCLLVGTASVASTGVAAHILSGKMQGEYTKFEQLNEAEGKAGYDIKAVKEFQNGYTFKEMSVQEAKEVDENNNVLKAYNQLSFVYEKTGENVVYINTMEAVNDNKNEQRAADETIAIKGIQIEYMMDTYKWVPVGYELTKKDEENLKRNDYYISEGADEVSETKVSYVVWVENGIRYSIMAHREVPSEMLFGMAKELICQN